MIIYILKFSACLAIFLAFYKLFLEQENMHQFKRFYLLGSIVTSIAIPFITFTTYVEPQPIVDGFNSIIPLSSDLVSETAENPTNYLPIILWSIYGIGLSLFGLKFGFNLSRIILKIKKNPNLKDSIFINVLLQDLVSPHTFFSYIFLNKYKYETHQIPEEVLLHEQTHAKQKHSLDILLIEILQVIFWFNPLIHVIKNAIKLNHEFLADKAVLNKGVETSNYQKVLLAFSTNDNNIQLANAINYSSIKKRITVMKTQTSKQKIWFRSLVLLPLLALTLYSFSEHKEVIKSSDDLLAPNTDYTARSISINALEDGTYIIEGLEANKNSFKSVINKLHQDITPEIRNEIMNIHVSSSSKISNEEVWFLYNSLLDYGFYRLVTNDQEVVNGKGNTPFLNTQSEENQDGASREQMKEYEKLAKYYNSMPEGKRIIKQKDAVRMKYIYSLMSDKQKKDTEPFPVLPPPPPPPPTPKAGEAEKIIPPPPPIPDNATPEQRKKYEEAIRKYKIATENSKQQTEVRVLSKEEVAKLKKEKEAYKNRQKLEIAEIKEAKSAEVEKLKKQKLAYQEARLAKIKTEKGELTRVRELRSQEEVQKLKKEKLAYQEARNQKIKTEKRELAQVKELRKNEEVSKLKQEKLAYAEAKKAKLSNEERLARVREIETPKPPRSPLDHVVDMAKKDAKFYLEGKEISSDEAIKALKENKHLNIQTLDSSSKQPKVYISKNPVVIEN